MSFWSSAGNAIGGIMMASGSAAGNYLSQQATNAQNRDISSDQMEFQRIMSNTAHVREVKDLKAAGLNPILSANAGASSPAGSSTTLQAPQIDMPSIIQAKSVAAQIDQGQQRINIDKALAASTIGKNLNDAEVARVNALATKGGALTNMLGTDIYEKTKDKKIFEQKKNVPNRRHINIPYIP